MAGHKYISNTTNLFEDDDVDDDTFVNGYRSRFPPPQPKPAANSQSYGGGHIAALEQQKQQLLQRQREIEQRTLDSSSRSIGLLRESEQIGIATAEELVRQRETLENTNQRLDEINTNLNVTQKHLNGIKSVFYGLKNYISGKSDQTPPPRSQTSPEVNNAMGGPSRSLLHDTIDTYSSGITPEDRFNAHPSTRLRGLDQQTMAEPLPDSQRINKILDENLDEMVQHITRLKGLGTALGQEIDAQNELIDNIHEKVEGADFKIEKQNKQMNKLLGK